MFTSSTWACVCCNLFCAAICCGFLAPPTTGAWPSEVGSDPGAADLKKSKQNKTRLFRVEF